MTKDTKQTVKKASLRYNEYYGMQEILDELYAQSKEGKVFQNLLELITSDRNIKLAYRSIKKNKGSKTPGTNGKNILDIGEKDIDELITYVRKRFKNFQPHSVKRVLIPKVNGKTRPLGIPSIEDRLVQQCILQILNPICEAKFYEHSYGFRNNRSTHHAVSRVVSLVNMNKLYYCVDIDIKGFFDNVNHGKLLKQMWAMGIRDKRLISIISKMLKAEIKGEGKPEKGVPQGGILSPLLSNIVLNELDWWIASQFQHFETKHKYQNNEKRFRALKEGTKLKEMFIVRYADDFKIMCRSYNNAKRVQMATTKWLKDRLSLETSPEKSGITNLRKQPTEFLGFKVKAIQKKTKRGNYVCKTDLTDKNAKRIKNNLSKQLKRLQKVRTGKEVMRYNSMVLGVHNYYRIATHGYGTFARMNYDLLNKTHNVTLKRGVGVGKIGIGERNKTFFLKNFGDYKGKKINVLGITLMPINGIKRVNPRNFSQDICNYTVAGRNKIHKNLSHIDPKVLNYLSQNMEDSAELADNKVSVYTSQLGLCRVSKEPLEIGNMHTHHIKPRHMGGTDEYKNLVMITTPIHQLIHSTKDETMKSLLDKTNLNIEQVKLVNKYRKKAGNSEIVM